VPARVAALRICDASDICTCWQDLLLYRFMVWFGMSRHSALVCGRRCRRTIGSAEFLGSLPSSIGKELHRISYAIFKA